MGIGEPLWIPAIAGVTYPAEGSSADVAGLAGGEGGSEAPATLRWLRHHSRTGKRVRIDGDPPVYAAPMLAVGSENGGKPPMSEPAPKEQIEQGELLAYLPAIRRLECPPGQKLRARFPGPGRVDRHRAGPRNGGEGGCDTGRT